MPPPQPCFLATHKGVEHQQCQGDTGEECGETKPFEEEVIDNSARFFHHEAFGDTLFFIALPLITALFNKLLLGHLAIENNEIHGEFLGTAMGVEKDFDTLDTSEQLDSTGGTLEEYGVWVKSGPEDIDETTDGDSFSLENLPEIEGATSFLTEEEESLLGVSMTGIMDNILPA